ncbi:hypothetical protein GS432_20010 [Rhodococcus hoagii]|nr:hypothetical protein [Prescottella equi]NKV08547.1 hypothetical protein [Prescottella equi]NKV08627.1 hypothetical protein [Prescottella equi]
MTSPSGHTPDRMLDGLSGIEAWSKKSRAEYEDEMLGRVVGSTTKINLFSLAVQAIRNGLASLFGIVDGHTVELAGLQDTTQKLEGVIGYAHGYITGGWSGQLGPAKRSVTGVIGTTVGVTRQSGAYFLHSKGLWVADARMNIDQAGFAVGTTTELQIRVYSPGGSLHAIAVSLHNTGARHPHVVHLPFTVPSAGYYVEFWADVPVARNAWGGSQFNGFSVEKRSLEET